MERNNKESVLEYGKESCMGNHQENGRTRK